MTVTADENLTDDRWYGAEDPGEPGGGGQAPPAPAGGEPPPGPDAPFGWTRDKDAPGGWRPKRSPGRPRRPKTAEELAAEPPKPPPVDKPPGREPAPPPPADVPMPKGGVIAKGVDKLYRKAGKILRAFDYDIGQALIECTRRDPDDPDDPTVGEAWEALARRNVRIRGFLVRAIAGGDWQDLVMAHAPLALALGTKAWVQRFIPFRRLAESMLEPDEDTEPGDLLPEDVADMEATAEQQAHRIATRMGIRVPPGVAAEAMRQAQAAANGDPGAGVPPGLRRQQQPRQTRAKRKRAR